jgi:hypothetical protein
MRLIRQTKRKSRKNKKSRKSHKHRKLSSRCFLSKRLRGGDLGNPTILTLEGTPLPSNAVVAHPTHTESLQSYLANQRRRGNTGYDDGD